MWFPVIYVSARFNTSKAGSSVVQQPKKWCWWQGKPILKMVWITPPSLVEGLVGDQPGGFLWISIPALFCMSCPWLPTWHLTGIQRQERSIKIPTASALLGGLEVVDCLRVVFVSLSSNYVAALSMGKVRKGDLWRVKAHCEVWSGECEEWCVKCGVWSGECEVWSLKCEV